MRATLTVVLAHGLLAAPLAAQAQQAGKVWRIGHAVFTRIARSPGLRLGSG